MNISYIAMLSKQAPLGNDCMSINRLSVLPTANRILRSSKPSTSLTRATQFNS